MGGDMELGGPVVNRERMAEREKAGAVLGVCVVVLLAAALFIWGGVPIHLALPIAAGIAVIGLFLGWLTVFVGRQIMKAFGRKG